MPQKENQNLAAILELDGHLENGRILSGQKSVLNGPCHEHMVKISCLFHQVKCFPCYFYLFIYLFCFDLAAPLYLITVEYDINPFMPSELSFLNFFGQGVW